MSWSCDMEGGNFSVARSNRSPRAALFANFRRRRKFLSLLCLQGRVLLFGICCALSGSDSLLAELEAPAADAVGLGGSELQRREARALAEGMGSSKNVFFTRSVHAPDAEEAGSATAMRINGSFAGESVHGEKL
eukprot:CAMPEP_0170213514 /NCGR_PEP_ID=MMETSP0116_2-20130129/6381_1 /TAXON_ID=400756 /ORGANISM="Durinskia baltica, Strain CSIRO CS-38" /LENGTH=133 /DNA_ID=CAMNT_0010464065 /DNA_START=98 /DNA_END=496 /DNA_ORIENTATION=+